jgi:hypothetical protein
MLNHHAPDGGGGGGGGSLAWRMRMGLVAQHLLPRTRPSPTTRSTTPAAAAAAAASRGWRRRGAHPTQGELRTRTPAAPATAACPSNGRGRCLSFCWFAVSEECSFLVLGNQGPNEMAMLWSLNDHLDLLRSALAHALLYYIIALLHYCIIALLHYCIIIMQRCCNRLQSVGRPSKLLCVSHQPVKIDPVSQGI